MITGKGSQSYHASYSVDIMSVKEYATCDNHNHLRLLQKSRRGRTGEMYTVANQ